MLEAHVCREGGNHAIAGDGGAAAVNGNATVNHAPPAQPPADALAAAVDAALAVAHDAILDDQRMCDACRTIALRHLRSAANRH
ncbi:MAG: hypothetical protein IJJ33_11440 [Victivallales bacterium]|nr:hypothetical protein [Victivallales bacterium]